MQGKEGANTLASDLQDPQTKVVVLVQAAVGHSSPGGSVLSDVLDETEHVKNAVCIDPCERFFQCSRLRLD